MWIVGNGDRKIALWVMSLKNSGGRDGNGKDISATARFIYAC